MKQIILQEHPVTTRLQSNRVVRSTLWASFLLLFPLLLHSQCIPETNDLSMCPGESTVLDGQPTGSGIYAWHQWEVLDEGTSKGVQFFNTSSQVLTVHTFGSDLQPGTLTLQYAYMDNTGCIGSKEITVTVQAAPDITLSPYAFSCLEGGMVEFLASPAGGTFSCDLPGALTDLANGTALFDPQVPGLDGQVQITYTVTNTEGCSSEKSQSVKVVSCATPTVEQISPCTPREQVAGSQGNASTPEDGQFEEQIIILDLSGSTWKMIQCEGFFQAQSEHPPITPLDFDLTGGGLNLVEGAPGVFELSGIHVDALGYNVQITNGPDTLTLTNTCYYPNPSMNTLPAGMCLGESALALSGSGGGALGIGTFDILDANAQQIVLAQASAFDPAVLGPGAYEVRYTFDEIPNQAPCMNCSPGAVQAISQMVEVSAGSETLACNDQVNVSLDETCTALITPDMLLEGSYASFEVFSVEIYDGINAIGDVVTGDYLDQFLDVKVINTCNGESCWGSILVNDKLGPTIDCPSDPILLSCALEAETLDPPLAFDNCDGPVIPFLMDELVEEFGCDGDELLFTRIVQVWGSVDSRGNEGESCIRILEFTKSDLSQVVIPPSLDDNDAPALDCASNASVDPSITGFPTVDGVPISLTEGLCKFTATYVDSELPGCGNSIHLLRTWTIFDWCAPSVEGENPLIADQVIKITDNTPPTIDCPSMISLIAGQTDCTVSDLLPAFNVQDDCSEFSVTVLTPTGVITGNGGLISGLAPGTYPIEYLATDDCGNVGSCIVDLVVEDLVSPVVICDEFTVVDLTTAGNAIVPAEVFDDGSYDFCTSIDFLVRRMDGNSDFTETIEFTCSDVGSPVQVVLQVTDEYGNSNTCMVLVTVQDKLPPVLTCPDDITLDCGDDYQDLNLTGNVEVSEPCDFDVEVITDDSNADLICGTGFVTRTFTATDVSGNQATCTQTISIENSTPFDGNTILWPADYETSFCDSMTQLHPDSLPTDPINYGRPMYSQPNCGLIAWSYEDEIFDISGPACFKVVRTWRIIDWCQFDPSNALGDGIWEHEQVIKVVDNTPPFVECVFDPFVKLNTPECFGTVTLEMPDSIYDCSPNITIEAVSDLGIGFGPFDDVAVGDYDVTYTITDQCGNATVCSYVLQVVDAKPPTPVCVNGYVLEINVSGAVSLPASDFNASSSDNCTAQEDLIYAFSSNWNDTIRTFGCDEVGLQEIGIYVFDEFYNFDFCIVPLIVQDNFYSCFGPFPISGGISTEEAEPLEGAMVWANGPNNSSVLTDAGGTYSLVDLEGGADYSITPMKEDDLTNGVTTFDIVLLTQHILGINVLTSPYKLIAADVNNSTSITTLDVVALQSAILGITNSFPNNSSWRFIDATHEFANPLDPWNGGFPEVINFNNLDAAIDDAHFTAIKVGDLNSTAQANLAMQPEARTFQVSGQMQIDTDGNSMDLVLDPGVVAWQLALECPELPAGFRVENDAVLWHYSEELQQLRLIWSSEQVKGEQGKVRLTWKENQLPEWTMNPAFSRVYQANGQFGAWDWNTVDRVVSGLEVIPNPMFQNARVQVWSPSAESTVQVRSLDGQLLFERTLDLAAGQHTVELQRAIFPTTGIYLVVCQTDDGVLTQKISVIE